MTQLPDDENIRMILKFDTGADGFMKMIYVLAVTAFVVLIVGLYYLWVYYPARDGIM